MDNILQKGFAPLLFVLIIGVLSAGIVGGAWYYKNFFSEKNKPPGSADQSLLKSSPSVDETASWAIYTNKFYQIKYPADVLSPKENKTYNNKSLSSVSFELLPPNDQGFVNPPINITISSFSDFSDPKSLFGLGKIEYGEENIKDEPVNTLKVDGIQGYYIEDVPFVSAGIHREIVAIKDGKLFTIQETCCYEDVGSFKNDLREKMLSTFRFVDGKDETAGWKVFEHSKFIFKYPGNLYIKETDKDFFVLLSDLNDYPSNSDFSIDARLKDDNANYQNAVKKVKEGLAKVNLAELKNGVKIDGELTGPAYGGLKVTSAVIRYKEGAIMIGSSRGLVDDLLFDKILAEFQVLE